MGFLIGIVARLVGKRFAPFATYGIIAALLYGAYVWRIHAAENRGREKEKAEWNAAIDKMNEDSDKAIVDADANAEKREEEWADRVKQEKEKIDEAIESGTDPFDVMFPTL